MRNYYSDPTASQAIGHVDAIEKEKRKQLIRALNIIADLCGYKVRGKIQLDKKKS